MVAKRSGRVLSVMVVDKGSLKLVRSLELASPDLADVVADLYPTLVFVEDQLGARAGKLLLAGFGERTEAAREHFQQGIGHRSGAGADAAGHARRTQRRTAGIPAVHCTGELMKVSINLASQPFRRDRPVIVAAVVLSVVLTGLLGVLILLAMTDRAQLADSRAEVARLESALRMRFPPSRPARTPCCASPRTPRCSNAACS